MQCSHFLLAFTFLFCFHGGLASWLTYGKVWSKDFGGEAAPNFTGQPIIEVRVLAGISLFLGNGFCGRTRVKKDGTYRIDCSPRILPFTDPSECVVV
uniref:Secreted protein n=2 Tax=Bursaphelenchus xylophilus TaxID=6326 RepID=A0A1I7SHP5_BURXY